MEKEEEWLQYMGGAPPDGSLLLLLPPPPPLHVAVCRITPVKLGVRATLNIPTVTYCTALYEYLL